jgi:hypothetical protein
MRIELENGNKIVARAFLWNRDMDELSEELEEYWR